MPRKLPEPSPGFTVHLALPLGTVAEPTILRETPGLVLRLEAFLGLTQADMARELCITRQAYHALRTNPNPSLVTLARLEEVFGHRLLRTVPIPEKKGSENATHGI